MVGPKESPPAPTKVILGGFISSHLLLVGTPIGRWGGTRRLA